MINQNLQADNQNGQQEPQAVNQGARTDNGSARAEGAAMTETPAAEQAGAVAHAGSAEPEGERAARVNVPKTGRHAPGSIRARRAAYSERVQQERAAKAAAAFPDLNDDIARVFVSNMLAQFDRAPADAEAFEKSFNESAALPGAKLAEEMERRINEAVTASGETGRRAEHLRFILRFYATLAPFMARDRIRAKLAGEDGKPTPKRRGGGRKKAAPAAGLPVPYYVYPYQKEMADIPQMISKGSTPKLKRIAPNREAKPIEVKAWEAPTGTKLAVERGIAVNLSVGVDQLFKWACVKFADSNDMIKGVKAGKEINRTVKITVNEWLNITGRDPNSKSARAHARQELAEYADFLSHSILYKITKTGEREIVKSRKEAGRNWGFLNLFSYGKLEGNDLTLSFGAETAEQLINSKMRKISAALFRLNGNNINAYRIECAALTLFTMDGNYGKPQANTLTVSKMLEYGKFATPEELKEQGQDWQKTKRALENALNAAVSAGVITGWRYCGTNGAELAPEEIKQLGTDLTAWEAANVWQDFPPLPADNAARIERGQKRKTDAAKRKEKSELEAMKKDVSGLKKTVYHRKKKQGGNQ